MDGVRKLGFPLRVAIVIGGVLLIVAIAVLVDIEPSLSHLDATLLSGPEAGNYHAVASRLSDAAAERKGTLHNQPTAGTVDNLERLHAARDDCSAQFALVQDGVRPPEGSDLQLLARLQKSESVFFIGKGAASLERFSELRGKSIGIGPAKSGTDRIARQILESEDFAPLGLRLENHDLSEQIERLVRGELDLGVVVIDEDAPLIQSAVRDRGLELASFVHLDVIARRFPFVWHGRIGAGQFDPIRVVPAEDHRVLRIDTLVVANRCPNHAEEVAMLSLLSEQLPGLLDHNKARGESHFFKTSAATKRFIENGGPDFAERHVPWLVAVLPPANLLMVVTVVSLLFNAMGIGNRFRLWRIDVSRVRLDQTIRDALGQRLTREEIDELEPADEHLEPRLVKTLDDVLEELAELRARCREHSQSMLVPMGQEMGYRFQEDQIEGTLAALRHFRNRLEKALRARAG